MEYNGDPRQKFLNFLLELYVQPPAAQPPATVAADSVRELVLAQVSSITLSYLTYQASSMLYESYNRSARPKKEATWEAMMGAIGRSKLLQNALKSLIFHTIEQFLPQQFELLSGDTEAETGGPSRMLCMPALFTEQEKAYIFGDLFHQVAALLYHRRCRLEQVDCSWMHYAAFLSTNSSSMIGIAVLLLQNLQYLDFERAWHSKDLGDDWLQNLGIIPPNEDDL